MSHPTDSELAILKALWTSAPQSARALQDGPGTAMGWSLSSTRTTLARMVSKGLLVETKQTGVRAYAPARSKSVVMAGLMRRFLGGVLELDGPLPVAAFTGSAVLTEDELAEIEALLADGGQDAT